MEELMDGWMDGLVQLQLMNGLLKDGTVRWMDGGTNGSVDGCMDG